MSWSCGDCSTGAYMCTSVHFSLAFVTTFNIVFCSMVSGWCCRAFRSSRFICSYSSICSWNVYFHFGLHLAAIYSPDVPQLPHLPSKNLHIVRPFHNELEWLFQSHTVNDVSTYHKLNRDPMMHIEKKVIDHVKRLHSMGYIPDKLKDKLRSSYSNPPGCTVRISQGPQKGYSAQTSHLKHRVTNIQIGRGTGSNPVHPDGNTKSFMKNSTEFVNSIRNLEIDDKDRFASFDVVSLSQVCQSMKP